MTPEPPADQWDYIVVGAGSAGCVIAARLAEHGAKVLLLEAGPRDWGPLIHIPAGVMKLLANPAVTWRFATTPDPATNNRVFQWPRGKVLGGTSSINGLLHVRGNPRDYDAWAQMGCKGWSYEDLLPFFKRLEAYQDGGSDVRGRNGPLPAQGYRSILPLTHAFVQAAEQAGYAFNPDYNGPVQDGVAYSQQTRRGRFRASATTYLKLPIDKENLHVVTQALATKLLFEGTRCTGVSYRRHGREQRVYARREVIVSASSIKSPQLLQCSGVGPAAHLKALGVEVVADLPGVGRDVIDHFASRITHHVQDAVTVNELSRGVRLAGEIARYAVTGQGALTYTVSTALLFARSRPGAERPDLQLAFQPFTTDPRRPGRMDSTPGMSIAVVPARPDSRGAVMARSPDISDAPDIRPNYLSAPKDLELMIAGLRIARRIFEQPALARFSLGETFPSASIASDAELESVCREFGICFHHQVGGCRMGDDPLSVVDPRLRVRGIQGLRVADASIMPTISTGNTNVPTTVIGEKAAAMILEDARSA